MSPAPARAAADESSGGATTAPTGRVVRVTELGRPAFQLRKGEEGISVFDPRAVDPPLTGAEILASFRPGSVLIERDVTTIEAKGLRVVPVEGAGELPERLRQAHREIQAGPGMTRNQFKNALKELE
jgi:hypothetical protein